MRAHMRTFETNGCSRDAFKVLPPRPLTVQKTIYPIKLNFLKGTERKDFDESQSVAGVD